jgi:hypothetical protein
VKDRGFGGCTSPAALRPRTSHGRDSLGLPQAGAYRLAIIHFHSSSPSSPPILALVLSTPIGRALRDRGHELELLQGDHCFTVLSQYCSRCFTISTSHGLGQPPVRVVVAGATFQAIPSLLHSKRWLISSPFLYSPCPARFTSLSFRSSLAYELFSSNNAVSAPPLLSCF